MRARILTTVSDSTSQKFMLVGQVSREDVPGRGRWALVYLDFAPVRSRKCGDNDFERWYARSRTHECLMGHRVRHSVRTPSMQLMMTCAILAMVQAPKARRGLLHWREVP